MNASAPAEIVADRATDDGDPTTVEEWPPAAWALALSLAALAYFLLFPFDFHVPAGWTVADAFGSFDAVTPASFDAIDVPLNVILFVPFGYAVASLVGRRRSAPVTVGVAAATSLAVSAAFELVQAYALVRFAASIDVVANTVGGTLGAVVWARWSSSISVGGRAGLRRVSAAMNPRRVVGVLAVYLVASVVLLAQTPALAEVSGWDLDDPLLVGNETTADRPWSGTVEVAYLLDRAVTDAELDALRAGDTAVVDESAFVVRHDFAASEPGRPPLSWQSGPPLEPGGAGVEVGPDDWLRSPQPAAEASAAIEASSELTLLVTATAAEAEQFGPARIVTLSDGLTERNLTLGQEGSALVLRLRTPLAGPDGSDPELYVPDVFDDGSRHDLAVRYDGSHLRIDVDDASHSMTLVPWSALALATFPNEIKQMRLTDTGVALLALIPQAVALVPFAMAMAAWWVRRRTTGAATVAAATAALLLPPLVLESALSWVIGSYDFDPLRVVFGVIVVATGWALLARRRDRIGDDVHTGRRGGAEMGGVRAP